MQGQGASRRELSNVASPVSLWCLVSDHGTGFLLTYGHGDRKRWKLFSNFHPTHLAPRVANRFLISFFSSKGSLFILEHVLKKNLAISLLDNYGKHEGMAETPFCAQANPSGAGVGRFSPSLRIFSIASEPFAVVFETLSNLSLINLTHLGWFQSQVRPDQGFITS